MFRRTGPGCFLLAAALSVLPARIAFGQELHLKSGRVAAHRQPMHAGRNGSRHLIVQFNHPPNADDVTALTEGGAKVVAALPDRGLMVSVSGNLAVPGSATWTGTLQVQEKLSGELLKDGWNAAVVEFHADVTASVQDEVGSEEGFYLERNSRLRPGHVLAYGSYQSLSALAAHDEVAYIFPADLALATGGEIHPCAGMLTQNGPVAQYSNIVHGWDRDSDGAAHLSYVFGESSDKVPALVAEAEILRAFSEWSKSANVDFEQGINPYSPRTVLVRFASGAHGDPFPFDGPGGVLAHTFYPVPVNSEPMAGDMHLDADENWHVGGDIDLYSVALHEAGHAIGLGHSDKPGDVMYPYYRTGMRLTANDIGAAQALYGIPLSASGPVNADPSSANPNPSSAAPYPAPVLTLGAVPGSVNSASLSLNGTIAGGTPPVIVTWQNASGVSGTASVSSGGDWEAANVPLQTGLNVLTVNAMDADDRSATMSVSVTLEGSTATTPTTSPTPTPTPTPSTPAIPAPTGPVTPSPSMPSPSSPATPSSPAGTPAGPLTLAIQSPAASVVTTSQASLTISGIASGGAGVSTVTWTTPLGNTGTVSVTGGRWVAANVPLLVGTNAIVVQAVDNAGSSTWSTVIVVRH